MLLVIFGIFCLFLASLPALLFLCAVVSEATHGAPGGYHATYSHQLNSWLCGRCGRPMGAGNPATIGDLCKICRGH
jgi:hypothetical protein